MQENHRQGSLSVVLLSCTKRTSTTTHVAVCQNLVPLVNIKIAGKWMFIPLKMVLIGIDPYPCHSMTVGHVAGVLLLLAQPPGEIHVANSLADPLQSIIHEPNVTLLKGSGSCLSPFFPHYPQVIRLTLFQTDVRWHKLQLATTAQNFTAWIGHEDLRNSSLRWSEINTKPFKKNKQIPSTKTG